MLRKTLILGLLLILMTACAPQATPTAVSSPQGTAVATEVLATQAPATQAPTETAVATTLMFTDGLGREVKLNGPAQRVISLAPSNTEILFAIGAGVKQLEDLGLTVYYLKNPLTLEEMYGNLDLVAQMTGHKEEAATLIESLKARVAAVDAKIAPISSRPSVFYELDATDPAKPYTAGKGTFITQLIDRAGGHNIAADLDGYPQMSLEQVVAADPAFIILGDARYGNTAESIAQRPGWGNLAAVKNGKVVPFNDDLVSRPGPRLVDALEELAKLLRPELFQ